MSLSKILLNGADLKDNSNLNNVTLEDIPLDKIHPNVNQPRQTFNKEKLSELKASILEFGIIQPILVHKIHKDGYEIIAGERRFRASKQAGLLTIPAIVCDQSTDSEVLEKAIVENTHRVDLNPIEEARGYKNLIEDFSLTQEALASHFGKSRTFITNHLRLLSLPDKVQKTLQNGDLSVGHAKVLLSINSSQDQVFYMRKVLEKGLSVRELETLVASNKNKRLDPIKYNKKTHIDKNLGYSDVELNLSDMLNTTVEVNARNKIGKGKLIISFSGANDLARIYDLLVSNSKNTDNP